MFFISAIVKGSSSGGSSKFSSLQLSSVNQKVSNQSPSVFILSVILHFKRRVSGLRTKLCDIFIQQQNRKLVSDGNRTEALNVKSSSQEPVSQFLKTLIIVELCHVRPLSFLLTALQISLLFL